MLHLLTGKFTRKKTEFDRKFKKFVRCKEQSLSELLVSIYTWYLLYFSEDFLMPNVLFMLTRDKKVCEFGYNSVGEFFCLHLYTNLPKTCAISYKQPMQILFFVFRTTANSFALCFIVNETIKT